MPVKFLGTYLPVICGVFIVAMLVLFIRSPVVRALKKYRRDAPGREVEKRAVRGTLGERLKENRTRCKMTQEFVAEALGVTRQAVSKWENGAADPSTANLIALAKLYGVPPEELLREL